MGPTETILGIKFFNGTVDEAVENPDEEIEIFNKQLRQTTLPFDLHEQIREWKCPPYPGFPTGMPSVYVYFVPGSGWGSDKPLLDDPTCHAVRFQSLSTTSPRS